MRKIRDTNANILSDLCKNLRLQFNIYSAYCCTLLTIFRMRSMNLPGCCAVVLASKAQRVLAHVSGDIFSTVKLQLCSSSSTGRENHQYPECSG